MALAYAAVSVLAPTVRQNGMLNATHSMRSIASIAASIVHSVRRRARRPVWVCRGFLGAGR